jgi:hypothetical protein
MVSKRFWLNALALLWLFQALIYGVFQWNDSIGFLIDRLSHSCTGFFGCVFGKGIEIFGFFYGLLISCIGLVTFVSIWRRTRWGLVISLLNSAWLLIFPVAYLFYYHSLKILDYLNIFVAVLTIITLLIPKNRSQFISESRRRRPQTGPK